MIWGKLIGSLFGLYLAGPIGLLLGLFLGHKIDKSYHMSVFGLSSDERRMAQRVFFDTTFLVMGHVAKVDGRVSENDIRFARSTMNRLGLSEEQRKVAIRLFSRGKEPSFNLNQSLEDLAKYCYQQRSLLQMFVEIQFQAAQAGGKFSVKKQVILKQICQRLGFAPNFNWDFYSHSKRQYGRGTTSRASSLSDAYALLNIKEDATGTEIKKAYRRQMSQNHPDKLISKGLPEEMIKLATDKTQKIRAAFDQIKQARKL